MFLIFMWQVFELKFAVQVFGGISFGSIIATNFVQMLEEYDVYYPEEED